MYTSSTGFSLYFGKKDVEVLVENEVVILCDWLLGKRLAEFCRDRGTTSVWWCFVAVLQKREWERERSNRRAVLPWTMTLKFYGHRLWPMGLVLWVIRRWCCPQDPTNVKRVGWTLTGPNLAGRFHSLGPGFLLVGEREQAPHYPETWASPGGCLPRTGSFGIRTRVDMLTRPVKSWCVDVWELQLHYFYPPAGGL